MKSTGSPHAEAEVAELRAALSAEKEAHIIDDSVAVERLWNARLAAEAALTAALADVERLREALAACVKTLHGCDYATQRVPLGVSSAIHKAAAALAATPSTGIEGVTNQEVDEFLKENRGATTPEEPDD